jgi:hypothetical protein
MSKCCLGGWIRRRKVRTTGWMFQKFPVKRLQRIDCLKRVAWSSCRAEEPYSVTPAAVIAVALRLDCYAPRHKSNVDDHTHHRLSLRIPVILSFSCWRSENLLSSRAETRHLTSVRVMLCQNSMYKWCKKFSTKVSSHR